MTTLLPWRTANGEAQLWRIAGFALAANVVLALIGPFGTMLTMDLAARLAHWLVSGCAIGAITALGFVIARKFWFADRAPFWAAVVAAAAAAAPGALIVAACLRVWSPSALAHVRLGELFVECLLINEALTLLAFGLFRARDAVNTPAPQPVAPPNALSQRLPRALRGARVLALTAEDHYLRVHTDRGDALIHMRISDAEALLSGGDGLRVHRSHWVARDAIDGVERKRGQVTLTLVNGVSIPIGRSRLDAVAKAGWPVRGD